MGKGFAQAQFCAMMAVLFKSYNVELAIEKSPAAGGSTGQEAWQPL